MGYGFTFLIFFAIFLIIKPPVKKFSVIRL